LFEKFRAEITIFGTKSFMERFGIDPSGSNND
jgi:hypothetical protein